MRAVPALSVVALAALLVVGAASGAVATPSERAVEPADGPGTVVPLPGTPNQAAPDSVANATYARADVDVAAAVSVGAARIGGRHAELTFEERFESAPRGTARLHVTTRTLAAIEARLDRLDDRQSRLFAAYSDADISRQAFLRRLAEIRVAARQERELLDRVSRRAETAPSFSLPTDAKLKIRRLRGQTVVLPTPVVDRVIGALTGTTGDQVVYLQAADSALVLAAIDEGAYVRQATLRAQRTPGEPNRFDTVEAALERARDLYPWVFENAIGSISLSGFGDSTVYLVEVTHPQGELRAYLDGATRNVFHEVQVDSPGAVPVTSTLTATSERLRIRVGTTHATGPMRVTVTRPGSPNATVDAAVRVNGHPLGRTGGDGQIFVVQPDGRFRVNATAGDASVTVTGP